MKMSKILAVILIIGLMVASPAFSMNVKTVTNNFGTGSSADYERVTIEVYNATDTAITTGSLLTWYLTNDDGRSVTLTNQLNMYVAGVADETIAASTWGTMLVYGYHSAVKLGYESCGSNVTTGYNLFASGPSTDAVNSTNSNDGKACVGYCNNSIIYTTPSAQTLCNSLGIALDTTTTDTTVEAIIDCL